MPDMITPDCPAYFLIIFGCRTIKPDCPVRRQGHIMLHFQYLQKLKLKTSSLILFGACQENNF